MLANYTIGVPSYPVHGMPMQTSVPMVAQQTLPAPTQNTPSNTSGLLEFSQMLADTKVGMSKIDMKIDEVLKKVDSIKSEPSTAVVPTSKPDIPAIIDPNVVLHSITKVVEESRTLKQELMDRDARIESLNQKARQLLESNQRYVEQSQHMIEQRSDSIHSLSSANNSHIIKLQEENSILKGKLDEARRKLESRRFEIGEQESDVSEMRKRNELLSQKMNLARAKFREKDSELDELKSEIDKLQRDAGKQKATRQTAQKEATDLNDTIDELRENIRSEKQSKKKIQNKLTRLDEELIEVKAERDRLTTTIEDRRKKQQNDKNKLLREIEDIKHGYEDEISDLKTQMQQPTGPTQGDLAKVEANWKRKMQEGIAKSISELEDKCEELTGSEQMLKSQVQRLEKKVTALTLENSHLQGENSRVLEELDEFESVQNRNVTSQALIDKQNIIIEHSYVRENELKFDINQFKEKEKCFLEEAEQLGDKIRELESHEVSIDGEEWRNRVKHVMNKFYASIQTTFSPQDTYTGNRVQELLREAIKIETVRVLNPDTDSTASTDTGDSADEASTPQDSLTLGTGEASFLQSADSNLSSSPTLQHSADTILGSSPTPQQSADINLSPSPTPQQSADINLSSSPTPQQSADINLSSSPTPQQSADINLSSSPTPQQSADINLSSSPTPQQSADINLSSSPTPQQSADINLSSSPTPQQSADINLSSSPTPQQSADINLSSSPTPQQSADTHLSSSPTPQQSADINLSSSPTPQQSADINPSSSPTPQQSADPSLSSSSTPQKSADTNPRSSSNPLQSPIHQSLESDNSKVDTSKTYTRPISETFGYVEDENRVEDTNLSGSTQIHDTVIPISSAFESAPLTSNPQPVVTDKPRYHKEVTSSDEIFSSPLDQSPSTSPIPNQYPSTSPIPNQYPSFSPPLDQSPSTSPIPNQYPSSSPIPNQYPSFSPPLDQSPSTSPIPNQYTTKSSPMEQSPSSSPIPNQYPSKSPPLDQSPSTSLIHNQSPSTSPIPNQYPSRSSPSLMTSSQPDISDSIQEYSSVAEPIPSSGRDRESPPPADETFTHLPSHSSSSPPPIDDHTSSRSDDPLTTGNFSPELIEKHFSSPLREELTSSLDAILGSSFPGQEARQKPQIEATTKSTMDAPPDTQVLSNPLLDGSSDSESDIFGTSKKKESPPLMDEKPIKATGKSLFEDSDDELDWLN
ncbi:FK506-binding protein 15 [Oopsacas minuta]|uniref:FK506-binding protein 15 n=1 Tax=Oopsacas minuta TaxID=111878 RepID=A0AAV7JLY7_9METZ|nr:FK506-binding protein 15 [Oopsacas minuta]